MPAPTKFVPRVRKQKAKARASVPAQALLGPDNSNATEIIPASKLEVEERRRKIREEIRAQQPESKFSSKKKKRLEHYIDTKLRKEENLELIRKLAAPEHKIDTHLLQSTQNLGRGSETKRELYGRVLKEKRAGIAGDDADDILLEERSARDAKDDGVNEDGLVQTPSVPKAIAPGNFAAAFGTGLKRPLELDESGNPVIKKRQRTKAPVPHQGWTVIAPAPAVEQEEDDWKGFSSEGEGDEEGGVELSGMSGLPAPGDSDEEDDDSDSGLDEGSSSGGEDDSDDDGDDYSGTEDSEDEEMVEDDNDDDEARARKVAIKAAKEQRASAFKAWANQERNQAVGFTPSANTDFFAVNAEKKAKRTADGQNGVSETADPSKDFLLGTLEAPKEGEAVRSIHNVTVTRDPAMQEARLALPVVAEEQKIMEAIYNNDTVIVWGATGSGKTTQVPQFLFEAGYGSPDGPNPGMIGVTQPRRVAAVSMAKRVSTELGQFHDKVAHQIRFDSTVSSKTAIKFMTDGVLLREISQDFMLAKYSAIVLDEAHERSVNTDLLIGMLCRIVEMRAEQAKKNETSKYKPLKLIIMSATLRTADLIENKNLFRHGTPPIVQAEGRQYPVTTHFTRRTERDYLEEAFNKVSRGHKKLPPGGMLVFLTGQNEITALVKRLKDTFEATEPSTKSFSHVRVSAQDATVEDEDVDLGRNDKHLDYENEDESDDDSILGVDNDEEFDIGEDPHEKLKVHVLPLYSQLPTDQQMRVFQPPPDGSRLIVLATNVAETSLTIPGIRYVFDCGRAKERQYDLNTGVQTFEVGWISKASASQRAGRAGRTGPGHCYRLYSSAVYERDFVEFADPEITRTPVEGVVLQLKTMGIPKVTAFPFPTPPDRESLVKAEKLLEYLGALNADGKVTPSGKELSVYPLSPRLSRMLCLATNHGVISHAITLVAALAIRDLFIPGSQLQITEPRTLAEDERWTEADNIEARATEDRRKAYNSFHGHVSRLDRRSDALKLLTLLSDFVRSSTSQDNYCTFTRVKAVKEALQLRSQLARIVATHNPATSSANLALSPAGLPSPTEAQCSILRQIVAAGYIDQVAIRADLSPTPPEGARKLKRAIDMPYITLFPSNIAGSSDDAEDKSRRYVYIHPSSVLAHTSADKLPQYLIYSHLSRSSPSSLTSGKAPKTRMHPLTHVSAAQLVALAQGTPLLEEGKPVGKVEVLKRDAKGRERRQVLTVPFMKGETGGVGWPLPPARSVVQVRLPGRGWVVEGQ